VPEPPTRIRYTDWRDTAAAATLAAAGLFSAGVVFEIPVLGILGLLIAGLLVMGCLAHSRPAITARSDGVGITAPDTHAADNHRGAAAHLRLASPDRVSDWTGEKCRECRYDPSHESTGYARVELEAAFRQAAERQEFRLYYQPTVSLADRRLVELEAMLRWERPGHGVVEPIDCMPIAEETGLILPIGRWALDEACRQAAAWQHRDRSHGALILSINVSTGQFQGPVVRRRCCARTERLPHPPQHAEARGARLSGRPRRCARGRDASAARGPGSPDCHRRLWDRVQFVGLPHASSGGFDAEVRVLT